ncbi:MAG: SDR family oxidoreductase [Bacteriovoracaceae bacterium]|nr:SDR family oxidoreductase [Bacteriovoracaceae bacterium]
MKLNNKVALITGASQGIGRAIALNLASEKINLALVGRNESKLKAVADECIKFGVKVKIYPLDLADTSKIPSLIESVKADFNSLSVLVNNAGTYANGNPFESNLKDWDYALDLNFKAVYHLTNQALKLISENDDGAIINISSIAGQMTYKGGEIYCATKYAVRAYSNCLFESVREKNIKVTCIFAGYVNTEMGRGENLDESKMIQPDDIALTVNSFLKTPLTACQTEIVIRPQRTPYK